MRCDGPFLTCFLPLGQRHPSVGSPRRRRVETLNGPTRRDHPFPAKLLKSPQKASPPAHSQPPAHLTGQRTQPVTPTLPGNHRGPTIKPKSMEETITDGLNRGLKPRPITLGAKTKNQPTIRTSIPPQKKSFGKPVKKRPHKPMPPDPALAPGTVGRPRPGKTLPLLKNLLDGNVHEE